MALVIVAGRDEIYGKCSLSSGTFVLWADLVHVKMDGFVIHWIHSRAAVDLWIIIMKL